jgi:NAD(P)H-hydrate epimerase
MTESDPSDRRALTCAEVRDLDRRAIDEFGVPGVVLMENAGRSCAELLLSLGCSGKTTIVCGKGNNGGDGYVIARHLELAGVPVNVVSVGDPSALPPDARPHFDVWASSGAPIVRWDRSLDDELLAASVAGSEWVIDALLGTGMQGAPRPPFDRVIRLLNRLPSRRFAVDSPSGLDCDRGVAEGEVFHACHTGTFVAAKVGFSQPAAARVIGRLHVLDIGAPRKLLEDVMGRRADD